MKQTRFPLSLALVALVGAATLQSPAVAQVDSLAAHAPVWVNQLGAQFSDALNSPTMQVRHDALEHITYFAYFYKDRIDLTDAVPALLKIYKEDDEDRCRLLALAGLHAIGDADAMQEVRRQMMFEKSPQVQFVTMAALMDYYGTATFEGDKETADLAKKLFDYYTSPRVIVGPPAAVWPYPQ